MSSWIAAILCVCLQVGCKNDQNINSQERSVLILAAASTSDAVAAVCDAFQEKTGIEVRISTGGSNALASQILAGAPADLFLSANPKWADEIVKNDYATQVVPLLRNRLVIAVPAGDRSPIQGPKDLLSANFKRIALAGENVPAGMYAEVGLRAAGVYDHLVTSGRIVRGSDVRIVLSYIERGEVDAGIVYATDARLTDAVDVLYTFSAAEVPSIEYPLVLIRSASESNAAARECFDYFRSAEAGRIFREFGFDFADQ